MSVSSALAVSMMIGTVLRERISRQTSKPSRLGHHHVEHHEVEVVLGEALERLLAVERGHHVVPLLAQRVGQELLNRVLVVHEQNARC